MALRSPLSNREAFIEKKKHADALHLTPRAKPTAKVKVKAKAKAAEVPASVILTKEQRDSDGSQQHWQMAGGAQYSS